MSKGTTTSVIASCQDCEWESQTGGGNKNARLLAQRHSKKTGHKTTAQVVRAYKYVNGRSVL